MGANAAVLKLVYCAPALWFLSAHVQLSLVIIIDSKFSFYEDQRAGCCSSLIYWR